MNKAEMKTKRQAVLRKIDVYQLELCNKCRTNIASISIPNCGCHAATKIRKLGDELIYLTSITRKERLDKIKNELTKKGLTKEIYNSLRENGLKTFEIMELAGMSKTEYKNWHSSFIEQMETENAMKRVGLKKLTVEKYNQHKEEFMKDKEIVEMYNLTKHDLWQFKKEKIKKGEVLKKRKPRITEERYEFWKLAQKNGVSLSTFNKRIRNGFSYEQAATTPTVVKKTQYIHLTVEEFMEYKKDGLTDKEIAKLHDVCLAPIVRFKAKHNLKTSYAKTKGGN